MLALFRGILLVFLAASISATPYSEQSDLTVTATNTRTIYTCPCDSTAYFAQTSPAIFQPSVWLGWQSSGLIVASSTSASVTSKDQTQSSSYTPITSEISTSSSSSSESIDTSAITESTSGQQSQQSSRSVSSTSTSLTTGTTISSLSTSSIFSPSGSTSTTIGSTSASSTISSILIPSSSTESNSASSTTTLSSSSSTSTSTTASELSSSTSSSSSSASTTPTETAFSIQISVSAPVGKRAGQSVGFSNGNAVLVDDASQAYAFAITAEGSLIIFGTTTTVGASRDDGVRNLQQILSGGTNAMLSGWTLTDGALTYPSVTFCLSSANELQVAFGIPPSSCNKASLVADTSPDSFNVALGQSPTVTSSTTTMTSATLAASCTVDVADPNTPCTPGRIYQQGGSIFEEYCDVTIDRTDGPPTSDFEARSYDQCSAVCARSPSCNGFGAPAGNPPSSNSGPCIMFGSLRFVPSTTPGSGYRGGKKLSAAPCGASATYVTTSTTSATSTGPVKLAAPTATTCSPRYPYPEDNCRAGQLYYYSGFTPQLYSATGCSVNITGTPLSQSTEGSWDACAKACMDVNACEAYMFTQFNPYLTFGNGYCNLFDTTDSFIGSRVPGWAGVKLSGLPPGCS